MSSCYEVDFKLIRSRCIFNTPVASWMRIGMSGTYDKYMLTCCIRFQLRMTDTIAILPSAPCPHPLSPSLPSRCRALVLFRFWFIFGFAVAAGSKSLVFVTWLFALRLASLLGFVAWRFPACSSCCLAVWPWCLSPLCQWPPGRRTKLARAWRPCMKGCTQAIYT